MLYVPWIVDFACNTWATGFCWGGIDRIPKVPMNSTWAQITIMCAMEEKIARFGFLNEKIRQQHHTLLVWDVLAINCSETLSSSLWYAISKTAVTSLRTCSPYKIAKHKKQVWFSGNTVLFYARFWDAEAAIHPVSAIFCVRSTGSRGMELTVVSWPVIPRNDAKL